MNSIGTYLLYITIFSASFNDILRIPNTTITLFRALVFWAVGYCVMVNRDSVKYLLLFCVIVGINFIQSVYYSETNLYGMEFSWPVFLGNAYLLFCVMAVIMIVATLMKRQENGGKLCMRFLKIIACLYLMILYSIILTPDFYDYLVSLNMITNRNDLAAYVAVILPVYLYEALGQKKLISIVWCVLAFLCIGMLGRKLVMFGMLIEAFVIFLVLKKSWKNILTVFACVVAVLLFNSFTDTINFQYIFLKLENGLMGIVGMKSYNVIADSESYRVAVFDYGMEEIINTKLLGVGIGNAPRLIPLMMPLGSDFMYKGDGSVVSVHNFIIQMLLEFGFLALLAALYVVRYTITLIRRKSTGFQYIYLSVLTGIWIWGLAPSGYYTLYYCYIVLTYVVCMNRNIRGFVNES